MVFVTTKAIAQTDVIKTRPKTWKYSRQIRFSPWDCGKPSQTSTKEKGEEAGGRELMMYSQR